MRSIFREGTPLKKLWLGAVGLGFTYWVIYILGNGILRFMLNEILGLSRSIPVARMSVLIIFSYFLFSLVCTWRSASNYEGRELWRVLAKISMFLGVIGALRGCGETAFLFLEPFQSV